MLLLVSTDGLIVAANPAACRRLNLPPGRLSERRLSAGQGQPAGALADYLRACTRSKEMLPGSVTLGGVEGAELPCRAEGNVFRPRSPDSPALVLLRLTSKATADSQFLILNQKVEQLSQEISRRRQFEQSLAAQREWLRTTLASIGDAVIAADSQGRITFLNSVAETLTGWTQDQAVGQALSSVFQIINEQTRQPAANPVDRALSEGVVVGLANHTVLLSRHGDETPIEDSAAPIRDAHGAITGVVLVFHDVSARRRAEREARRFKFISDHSSEAHFLLDAQGRFLYVNELARQRLGYSEAELLQMSLFDIDSNYDPASYRQFFDRTQREPDAPFETIHRRRDGSTFPVEISVTAVAFEQEPFVFAVARDITQRKKAEQERDRLISVIEYSPDFIGIAGLDRRTRFLNRAGQRLVGLDGLEQARQANLLDYFPEDERLRIEQDILPLLLAEGHWDGEVLFRHFQTGARIPVRWNVFTLPDAETGEPRYLACVSRDITQQKQNELLLEGQKRVLERMVHGAPLSDVLEAMCEAIERQGGDRLIATVLLLDEEGARLRPVAGRRAPEGWSQAIDGLSPGPRAGSCGTAAYLGKQVIVSDIAADPLWTDYREQALSYGLRACWSTPIFSSQGRVLGTFAVYFDSPRRPKPDELQRVDILARTAGIAIERIRSEQALRDSEEQFRTLADSIPQLAWMTGPDGHIFWYNRRWYEYTGATLEQMAGWGWQSVHDPAELPRVLARWKTALAEQTAWEDAFPLRRRDGRMRWHLSRAVPIRDERGRVVRWFGTNTDITDQKEAEARLSEYAERQRLLWEAAAVLLVTDEPDAMLYGLFSKIGPHFGFDVYFNFVAAEGDGALQLVSCVGISEENARKINTFEFGETVCGAAVRQRRPFAAGSIQQSQHPTLQVAKQCGIKAYACMPLHADGRLLGALTFASRTRDRFEDEELEFFDTICGYVTLACERLRLVAELRESDRRKDEFLATLAHELRNPLAPIRNSLQLLRLTGDDPAMLEQARSMMGRQLEQMVRLIDDLLDVSRISQGKLELRKQWVELATVVQNAVEMARPFVETAGHELTVSLPPEPILLDADLTRLSQVFANLLNNAAKYTGRGGRISVVVELREGAAVVRVQDTGIGIPAEQLRRIFEMFVQVDRSLERAQGGLGIGLTLVKRLVEMHGGTVQAFSEGEGRGSEFVVRLPVVNTRQAEPRAPVDEEPTVSIARRKILVVDDNEDSAKSLSLMLELLGHEIRTAHDGLEALDIGEAFRPDVVLLDLGMPRLNGYAAAGRIREREWGRSALLVALTGWGQDEDRRRTRQAGFDEHLVKPAELSALTRLLSDASGP